MKLLTKIIRSASDSAPGPDGIPYSAWAACPRASASVLYAMMSHALWVRSRARGWQPCLLAVGPSHRRLEYGKAVRNLAPLFFGV